MQFDDDHEAASSAADAALSPQTSGGGEYRRGRQLRHAFIAGLAHDLRSPLAPLSNGLELLRLTDADPAGRLRTRGILERQMANLLNIADMLSELARLTSEEPALSTAEFTIGALARAVADGVRPALETQSLNLVLDVAGAHGKLRGDAQRLAEALKRLVQDLARHCERGSDLRLTARLDESSAVAEFTIAPGAKDEQPGQDEEASSLGLGPAIAQQLAELMGGTLSVSRAQAGRQARFRLRLPLAGVQRPALEVSGHAGSALLQAAPLAVLLADDNIDFSHSFATMLELLGHRVEVVHDGLAAVAAIVASPPDIAFIDIGMPTLDGFDAVQRVRGLEHTGDVMLVAVTGRGGAEDRARAAECGFDRYLVKPFAMQDVRDALALAQERRNGSRASLTGHFAPQTM